MVTPTATAPELTARGLTNVLRTCGRDDQQAEVAAAYVLKNLKDKRIAIIHDKGTYGQGLADAFKAALNAGGVEEVEYNSLTPGEKDLSALVTRLKSGNVDVIYFGGYHPEGGLLGAPARSTSASRPPSSAAKDCPTPSIGRSAALRRPEPCSPTLRMR